MGRLGTITVAETQAGGEAETGHGAQLPSSLPFRSNDAWTACLLTTTDAVQRRWPLGNRHRFYHFIDGRRPVGHADRRVQRERTHVSSTTADPSRYLHVPDWQRDGQRRTRRHVGSRFRRLTSTACPTVTANCRPAYTTFPTFGWTSRGWVQGVCPSGCDITSTSLATCDEPSIPFSDTQRFKFCRRRGLQDAREEEKWKQDRLRCCPSGWKIRRGRRSRLWTIRTSWSQPSSTHIDSTSPLPPPFIIPSFCYWTVSLPSLTAL